MSHSQEEDSDNRIVDYKRENMESYGDNSMKLLKPENSLNQT
jgi:hypothetical protein